MRNYEHSSGWKITACVLAVLTATFAFLYASALYELNSTKARWLTYHRVPTETGYGYYVRVLEAEVPVATLNEDWIRVKVRNLGFGKAENVMVGVMPLRKKFLAMALSPEANVKFVGDIPEGEFASTWIKNPKGPMVLSVGEAGRKLKRENIPVAVAFVPLGIGKENIEKNTE